MSTNLEEQMLRMALNDYRWEEGHPPPAIQIEVKDQVLWINFNGICIFRGCNLPNDLSLEMTGLGDNTMPDKTGYMWKDYDGGLGSIVYATPASVESLKPWRVPVEIYIVEGDNGSIEPEPTPESKSYVG